MSKSNSRTRDHEAKDAIRAELMMNNSATELYFIVAWGSQE